MPALPLIHRDEGGLDFIDDARLESLLRRPAPGPAQVRELIAKSLSRECLSVEETALLLRAQEPAQIHEIAAGARRLKDDVYGNRIVLFAPLYVGNDCVNDCTYCGFRRSNPEAVRCTLSTTDLERDVRALERQGHKRLILVFGEHPRYDARFIADAVRAVYAVREGSGGEIRRVNVNAAPFDVAGFRTVHEAGIGTYQVFQETYHHASYARVHPRGTRKGDYLWRLGALDRAMQAGCDDVGIGALFGLHDWRFEVLGLVSHALHLQARHGVGPHTISFPRLRPAPGVLTDARWAVSDEDFLRLVAILRLAVPYTGLICTAREEAEVRREALRLGVSQIDGGSRIDLGGYGADAAPARERSQFDLGDPRGHDEVMRELVADGHLPSFCTACYRLGRTGEHFMEFAVPGFIK
ncbi:MAG: [FeFe] hydrogenase H-cluster radical SAM maturase HydG, partial [Solirubrobacteraceae bacterium]|nr:[FeFe] hydrogenase H-cluster radical SAM maturase HydG [Solirubrobacteraceae bacterium]